MPKIDGIYRREDLGDFPLVSAEETDLNTAVFITHLHLDHMALMGTLSPEIPVYMHHNAQIIERALEATGCGIETLDREYRDITPFEPISVGEIKVLPILCRDTSYYDFAFLITTPDGTIHWTGDVILHSKQADKTIKQMELLKEKDIDVMLCDCTAFMDSVLKLMVPDLDEKKIMPNPAIPENMLSEEEYHEGLFESLKELKGLCVFNYYQREMDMAQDLMRWAEKLGRKCVFEPDAAYIVYKFFGVEPYVYIPDSPSVHREEGAPWRRELAEHSTVVSHEDICAEPSKYMLQNSYPHIMELFDLPNEGAGYIHADGIPIGAFDPAYANMRKIVDKAAFKYVTFFCENYFGHGYPQMVKYFVDEINPRVLIPCHSYNPERLLPKDGIQLIPESYKEYILENHVFSPRDQGGEK